jgi:hypothetical protein
VRSTVATQLAQVIPVTGIVTSRACDIGEAIPPVGS